MTTYVSLFINVVVFSMLKYTDYNLLIEKINIMTLLNIVLMFSFAIYSKKILNHQFHIHLSSFFILIILIIYNWVVFNQFMLVISVALFILLFILDYVYDSISVDKYEKDKEARTKTKTKTEYFYDEPAFEDMFEEKEDKINLKIDVELEAYLVLLGLKLDYTLKQLKVAYKIAARENHPDKHSSKDKKFQTIKMQEINNAKSFLEDRLK